LEGASYYIDVLARADDVILAGLDAGKLLSRRSKIGASFGQQFRLRGDKGCQGFHFFAHIHARNEHLFAGGRVHVQITLAVLTNESTGINSERTGPQACNDGQDAQGLREQRHGQEKAIARVCVCLSACLPVCVLNADHTKKHCLLPRKTPELSIRVFTSYS
jgi:hypothetical protein